MLKLTAFALFAAFLGAEAAAAQTMTLTSPDIAPGAQDRRRAGGQRLWLHRRQHLARALLVRRAEGHEELRALGLRSRRADGQRFLALGRLQHPADVTSLPKDAGNLKGAEAPKGAVQSRTDFGVPGYGGPCPPKGDPPHHYHFTIFAVDTPKLDGDENTSAAVVGFMLHFHTLAKGGADRRVRAVIVRPHVAHRSMQFT